MTKSSKRLSGRWLAWGCVALVGVCQGCGTGEYEKRLQQRVSTMGQESAFSQLGNAVQVPGTPLVLNMPNEFQPLPANSDPKRLKIPSVELPEWKATYEATLTDSAQGKQHYYCYVATADFAAAGGNDPSQGLLNRVRVAFRDGVANPTTVQVATPSGQNQPWQKYRAIGKQTFLYTDAQGQSRNAEMEGLLEVWSRRVEEGGCFVIIAWRVPTVGGQDFVKLDQKAALVAGSLAVRK